MYFISFCGLIFIARTSSTTLNRTSESGHPCLISDLRGEPHMIFPVLWPLVKKNYLTNSIGHTNF